MSLDTCAGRATVAQTCRTFAISRAAYYAARRPAAAPRQRGGRFGRVPAVSADKLKVAIQRVVDEHPAWGIRKVWATLRRGDLTVSLRRVGAFMKAMGLTLAAEREHGAPHRAGTVAVPEANRRWGTDLTTTWTRRDGLVAIVPVVDCGCRSVLQLGVTRCQESRYVLEPLERALERIFGSPDSVPDAMEIRTDHGPQYTGADCEQLCERWNLDHTLAPVGRPTGNSVTERVIRTMKEECLWLQDFDTIEQATEALDAWRLSYNERRPHQSLDWKTPSERRLELLGAPDRVAA